MCNKFLLAVVYKCMFDVQALKHGSFTVLTTVLFVQTDPHVSLHFVEPFTLNLFHFTFI